MGWHCRRVQYANLGHILKILLSNGKLCDDAKNESILDGRKLRRQIMEAYAAMKLTNESDILPAVSALQLATRRVYYLAGLWEVDLLVCLFRSVSWYLSLNLRPLAYLVPKFSWTSERSQAHSNEDNKDETEVIVWKASNCKTKLPHGKGHRWAIRD